MSVIGRGRRLARRVVRSTSVEWYSYWRAQPIRSGTVLFESFAGNGAACNPEALFRALLAAPDQQHRQLVWALAPGRGVELRREFRDHPRVRFVERDSAAYWRVLGTAGTLVNNATFPPAFARRDGQVYLNTWHGTPLKRMGFDEPDGATASANVLRNFLNATHLLSQSPMMTERMYRGSYRLTGVFQGEVLEVGYPRNDRTALSAQSGSTAATTTDAELRRTFRDRGFDVDGRAIVLYAPTWRGERFNRAEDDSLELAATADRLQAALDERGASALVIVRPHQIVAQAAEAVPALRQRLVPEDLPTNAVLAATDVLISDYSSIIVDFVATGRPIVLAHSDLATYATDRGLDVADDEWPGVRATTPDELADAVTAAVLRDPAAAPSAHDRALADLYVPRDDGHASERVLDAVFRPGAAQDGVVRLGTPTATRILLHIGALRDNGITTAAMNLLPRLADAGYDVTVTHPHFASRSSLRNRHRIDPRVRVLQRTGGMNGSKTVQVLRRAADLRADARAHARVPALRRLWDDEWRRCFGTAEFDVVVDFSGYAPFWAQLLLHAPSDPLSSVWLHNDIESEVDRLVGGRPTMRRSLRAMIALFGEFDHAVSVSPALSRRNAAQLGHRVRAHWTFARNLIDAGSVLTRSQVPMDTVLLEAQPPAEVDFVLPEWVADLRTPGDRRWFVSLGRLSPEKNHDRLLDAFALVAQTDPAARLLIVGDGPLRAHLEARVADLGIADVVVFTGTLPNPYPLLAAAECLVVSSNYEGQPMVILEAAVLGKAVVSTRFASAEDALPDGGIELVDLTPRGLADGMLAFLAGRVPPVSLDDEAYNSAAFAEFVAATTTREGVSAGSTVAGSAADGTVGGSTADGTATS
ncbi:glycosyltransferase [Curtobacterium sp. ISL-83]|uniref:glycosyltransferase n=1 Tax=Curtobacterium sp. ISL-83 TaxID=2819145 RepID=UPI001BE74208|nr:glycosyltransferase [Curtobacterium sp. ISL-83]MBT2501043.1 CDP-glycerol glycerophosphotransferase family protein [Curtobacterium sp. ISL-83]